MHALKRLWDDQAGAVVSAELATVVTVGLLGGIVGLKTATTAVNEEWTDVASALRSLDQSYFYTGFAGDGSCIAGSCYVDRDGRGRLEKRDGLERNRRREDGKPRGGRRDRKNRSSPPVLVAAGGAR